MFRHASRDSFCDPIRDGEPRDRNRPRIIGGTIAATAVLTLMTSVPVGAQSINVDFGDTFGTPAPTYGAAGEAGVWNAFTTAPGTPRALVGLDGRALQATLTVMNLSDGLNDGATSGADQELFDDGLLGLGDVVSSMTFEGLAPGTYQVIAYAWTPTLPTDLTTVLIDDDWDNGGLVGGAWPGEPQEDVTHATITGATETGTLTVSFMGSFIATGGFLNGVQLVRVDPAEFDSADVDQDGTVGFADLLILLSNWSPGHGCNGILQCLGDLNQDTFVDFADVLILLGAWTG